MILLQQPHEAVLLPLPIVRTCLRIFDPQTPHISIPLNGPDPHINQICGLQSGRSIDKVKEAGLTLVEPVTNHTPAVAEYPLTLECKVLYAQKQDLSVLPEEIRKSNYPADVDGTAPLSNRDPHTVYIGEIVNAYILGAE